MGTDIKPLKSTAWVDVAKGIGIITVIGGHVFTGLTSDVIYLFHMPLFFFIAGFLFSAKPEKSYFKHKAKKLLIPYIVFLILFFMINTLLMIKSGEINLVLFLKLAAINIYGGAYLKGWAGVFWFVTVFFITQQLFNIINNKVEKNKIKYLMLLSLSFAYVIGHYIKIPLPLNLGVTFYALPTMYAGYCFRQSRLNLNLCVALIISTLGVFLLLSYPDLMKLDMKSSIYGLPIFSFILSIAMITIIIRISSFKILKNDILVFAGKESMIIMYIHQFLHLAIAKVLFKNEYVIFLFTVIISLIMSYVFYKTKKIFLLSAAG